MRNYEWWLWTMPKARGNDAIPWPNGGRATPSYWDTWQANLFAEDTWTN